MQVLDNTTDGFGRSEAPQYGDSSDTIHVAHGWNSGHLSSVDYRALRQIAVREAQRFGLPPAWAEDVAQHAVLDFCRYPDSIQNPQALLATIVKRRAIKVQERDFSRLVRATADYPSIRSPEANRVMSLAHPGVASMSALDGVALADDDRYDLPRLVPRPDAGEVVLRCFRNCRLPLSLQRYLIMQVALFGDTSPFPNLGQIIHDVVGKRPGTIEKQRQSAQDKAWGIAGQLAEELDREHFDAGQLCDLLRTPEKALLSPELGVFIAETTAALVRRLADVGKYGRLDIIIRSGAWRHNAHRAFKERFIQFAELLYAAARIRRRYIVPGVVVYLYQQLGKRYGFRELLEDDLIEQFLYAQVVEGPKRLDVVDHWLATIALGGHYENVGYSVEEVERKLESVEQAAQGHPLSEIGASFSWLNVARDDRKAIFYEKVYRAMTPDVVGRFAFLPLTLLAPYLGKPGAPIESISNDSELWEATLRVLSSPSQVVQLGGLIQLQHIPIPTIPSQVKIEVSTLLRTLVASDDQNIQKRAKTMLHQANCI